MDRRWTLIALVVAAVVAAAVVALTRLAGSDAAPPLRATLYPQAIPAPATLGRDSDGAAVQVPRTGRPALVTFLFATCPDVCPLVGQEISLALDEVGADARGVDVVAISVDPAGDTPAAVRAFLRGHRLTGRMRYIVGTRAQLQPLWRAWGVIAQPTGNATTSVHTAKVVLVDDRGLQVGSYSGGVPFAPSDLAADIRTLLGS